MLCQQLQVHGLAQALLPATMAYVGMVSQKITKISRTKGKSLDICTSIQPQCILLGCTSHHKPSAPSGPAPTGTQKKPCRSLHRSSPHKAGRHNPQSDACPLEEGVVPVVLNGRGKAIPAFFGVFNTTLHNSSEVVSPWYLFKNITKLSNFNCWSCITKLSNFNCWSC